MAPNADSKALDVAEQESAEVSLISNKALIQQFAEMAIMIPGDDENAVETILQTVLMAQSWDQLDAPWQTSDIEDVLNKELILKHAKRLPSTFTGGLGTFLVLFLEDPKTHQEYVKSSGSISIVGQVACAYARDWMPLKVKWRRAERASNNGFYPQHLQVIDAMGNGVEVGHARPQA